jgi:hypothetical protein
MFLIFIFLNIIVNYVFWWSTLLFLTIIFVFLAKVEGLGVLGLSLFFLFQEVVGIIFLFNFSSRFQEFIIILKVGVSPLHFWLFYLRYFLDGYLMVWLFVLYKFCVFPIVLYLLIDWLLIIILGLYYIYFQLQENYQYKFLFFFSAVESFGWLLLILCCSLVNFIFFFLFYYRLMVVIFLGFYKVLFFNMEYVFFFFWSSFDIEVFYEVFFFRIFYLFWSVFCIVFIIIIFLI